MNCYTLTDGIGKMYAFLTDANPNLLGHHYTLSPEYKAKLLRYSMDQADMRYFVSHPKQMIPKDSIVSIKHYWMNFYGAYFRVIWQNKEYDIKASDVELIKQETND